MALISIPGNDDAIRAIELYASVIADACIEGAAESLGKSDYVEVPADAADASVQELTSDQFSAEKFRIPKIITGRRIATRDLIGN